MMLVNKMPNAPSHRSRSPALVDRGGSFSAYGIPVIFLAVADRRHAVLLLDALTWARSRWEPHLLSD